LRELKSLENIDINNNFKVTYENIDTALKQKQIKLLRSEINIAYEVIIATDNDREGEAIGWHICELFNLSVVNTKRIIFQEITEEAIQHAIKNPTTLNLNIINSQQTRQILDLLVGFKITPLLWKFITNKSKNSLSAGRCQSPALKIIYDNYNEIINNPGKKVYNTTGYFTNLCIPFELNKRFELEDDVIDFLDASIHFNHIFTCELPPKQLFREPPEPLITSKLQQMASSVLNISPKETMTICQGLYEDGLITYMRTDSKKYSNCFIEKTRSYILQNYDEKYISSLITGIVDTRVVEETTQVKEAHEAIRPTNICLQELTKDYNPKEKKMYKLIWENALESCMSAASVLSLNSTITASHNLNYSYKCEHVIFPGWLVVKKKYKPENPIYNYLLKLKQQHVIHYRKITSNITLIDTKSHYSEAALVQTLEEKGIGRPSTFSMLIDKIQERGYVIKEDVKGKQIVCKDYELEDESITEIEHNKEFGNERNKLIIQPMGVIVMQFLETHFNDLFNYNYTREMEDKLDKIALGEKMSTEMCKKCYDEINQLIHKLSGYKKQEYKIDDTHIYTIGQHGPVIKCIDNGNKSVTFKSINPDIDITKIETGEYSLEELVDNSKTKIISSSNLGKHEGKDLIIKNGKFGLYLIFGDQNISLKSLGNRPPENITMDDIKHLLNNTGQLNPDVIRQVSEHISIRRGKPGKDNYILFKTPKMKKPSFFSIKDFNENIVDCDIVNLQSWIKVKYNIF
jgi:DNA topoisomerase-1